MYNLAARYYKRQINLNDCGWIISRHINLDLLFSIKCRLDFTQVQKLQRQIKRYMEFCMSCGYREQVLCRL